MSSSWEQSRAAARLRAVAELEVEPPPPLARVREVAGLRARRAAQLMAFAVAIPLGAMAAGGAYVWRAKTSQRVEIVKQGTAPAQRAVQQPALPQAPALQAPVAIEPRAEPEREVSHPAAPAVVEPVRQAAPPAAPKKVAVEPAARAEAPAGVGARPAAPTPVAAGSETAELPAVAGYAPAAPPARTSLSDESSALSEALLALRGQRDPARALELLVAYGERFPAGALRREAALATVEAHRALGHTSEALPALDALPRRPELDVLRAELDAELGRCDEARAAVRGLALAGGLLERALFTDATCAITLGARDEAIADLERLPDSARAKALLEKLR